MKPTAMLNCIRAGQEFGNHIINHRSTGLLHYREPGDPEAPSSFTDDIVSIESVVACRDHNLMRCPDRNKRKNTTRQSRPVPFSLSWHLQELEGFKEFTKGSKPTPIVHFHSKRNLPYFSGKFQEQNKRTEVFHLCPLAGVDACLSGPRSFCPHAPNRIGSWTTHSL